MVQTVCQFVRSAHKGWAADETRMVVWRGVNE